MVRYYYPCGNTHRGKLWKAGISPFALRVAEEEEKRIPSKGWATMIRKVYEVEQREKAIINFLYPKHKKVISYAL